jgi:hypothetical protein
MYVLRVKGIRESPLVYSVKVQGRVHAVPRDDMMLFVLT